MGAKRFLSVRHTAARPRQGAARAGRIGDYDSLLRPRGAEELSFPVPMVPFSDVAVPIESGGLSLFCSIAT